MVLVHVLLFEIAPRLIVVFISLPNPFKPLQRL